MVSSWRGSVLISADAGRKRLDSNVPKASLRLIDPLLGTGQLDRGIRKSIDQRNCVVPEAIKMKFGAWARMTGVLAVLLCMTLAWAAHFFSGRARIVRVARDHGIEMGGAIVTLELLDSSTTTLGNSGHETYRVAMTENGFQSVLSQIRQAGTRDTLVDLESFGFTSDSSDVSHCWVSDNGGNLFVIVITKEALPVIELCSAW